MVGKNALVRKASELDRLIDRHAGGDAKRARERVERALDSVSSYNDAVDQALSFVDKQGAIDGISEVELHAAGMRDRKLGISITFNDGTRRRYVWNEADSKLEEIGP